MHSSAGACASSTEPAIRATGPSARSFFSKSARRIPPSYEVINTHFFKENTTILVHTTIEEWTEGERYFQIVERVPGVPLEEIWSSIPQPDREKLARQTTEYLGQLRSFHSAKMESGYVQHGPPSTAEELWDALAKPLSDKVPEVVRLRLRDGMPPPHPRTFTHGDLTNCNIIVDPTNFELSALIEWESSGYFPVWWEFTGAGFGLGEEDAEWKWLLLGNLANHKEARTWFLEFKSFASRSSDSQTLMSVPKECGIEEDIEI
ncbi:Aminoglycoside phosphotransferase [Penicillium fimorum]|uniref:Aminoglycoside phosphotransferase n=1 Tax=Penicillium fimorum TaxID=1882269 RepID=A0A9X0C6R1_9EURO|nr:Aminoglycoside phosphotransferase [Penicillium fimorum]